MYVASGCIQKEMNHYIAFLLHTDVEVRIITSSPPDACM